MDSFSKVKKDYPPLLLTSSVVVSAPLTKLIDTEERIRLTIASIGEWLRLSPEINIVLCDGSGFDFSHIIKEYYPAAHIESLFFENNAKLVSIYGKGFGEGEIIKYALENSEILKCSAAFSKCTSKLWVNNYFKYIEDWDGLFLCDCNFSNLKKFNSIKLKSVDTRFYVVKKEFYLDNLLYAYKDVRDQKGYYLEHSFCDIIIRTKIKNFISTIPLEINGISGSSAFAYRGSVQQKIKNRLKRFILIRCSEYSDFFVNKKA